MSKSDLYQRSVSTDPKNLLIESDLVLNNLDKIIDSHSRKLHKTLSINLQNSPVNCTMSKKDKLKSKSYLINSNTVSNNYNLMQKYNLNPSNTVSSPKTNSFVNPSSGAKKKRSSLFNLFSFSSSSSSTTSKNQSTQNLAKTDSMLIELAPIAPPVQFSDQKSFNKFSLFNLTKSANENETNKNSTIIRKKPSIRSKGFSIPLNASYLPNSSQTSIIQENLLVLNKNENLYEDINEFNNLRLKYADIKSLEDEFNEKETFEIIEKKEIEVDRQSLKSSCSSISPALSPNPSILTLSLNNQCSTATTTLNDNLNSINFVDNLNLNMFSQQQQQQKQNRSKTNISKIMVNYNQQEEKEEEEKQKKQDENKNDSIKKKRFQQFQAQSLINLNLNKINNIYETIEESSNEIRLNIETLDNKLLKKLVQIKKGIKLKNLFKSVLLELEMNLDEFDLFNNENDLIDLSQVCDQYSNSDLYLKKKLCSKARKSSLQIQTNLCEESKQQSINWQNYFVNSKSKNSKQKRNSCIAVMNDFNSGSNSQEQASITSNMRDSVNSFQNFIFSNNIIPPSGLQSERIVRQNRNFRRIAQISSIFSSYSQTRLSENSNCLTDQLSMYLKELPKLADELNIIKYEPSILEIESDWYKFVGDSFAQSLPIKLAKQQMAIWELLSTECSHIKTTRVIIDVFLNCLLSLKQNTHTQDMFKDIDIKKLFSNIIEVFNCNLTFWQKYLNPILTNLQSGNNINLIIDPILLFKPFSQFQNLFLPYEEFILERNNSIEYFKQKLNENENFSKFITWAENHPLVGRLKISDFMMIPVQRLTKYQLLIENILQHTEDDDKREKITLIKEWVNALPNSINMKLSYLEQFNDISESIEKYDAVQAFNEEIQEILNTYKKFDIKSPLPGCSKTSVRELIHQGPLRLKDLPKSLDVHCFLFTDMLLITQQKKTKKYKIIKPPISTKRMLVKELTQTDKAFVVISLNEYNLPDSVSMFISNQSKKWIEFLELSKKKYLIELEKFETTSQIKKLIGLTLDSEVEVESSKEIEKEKKITEQEAIKTEPEIELEATKRRDSSTTLTQIETEVVESKKEENIKLKSPMVTKKPKNQLYQSRLIDRRIERQRRNMTDPNQNTIDERHVLITKRNSLNDKSNMSQKLVYGDSTSTILSTDSGVVVNNDLNHNDSPHETVLNHKILNNNNNNNNNNTSPHKTIKLNANPSSPTSSSYSNSSDPIYSNLSISSSSSNSSSSKFDSFNKKTFKPTLLNNLDDDDYYEDDDLMIDDDRISLNNLEINENQTENKIDENLTTNLNLTSDVKYNSILYDNPSSFMFKKMPNIRIKQQSIGSNQKQNIDLNNNNQTFMFSSSTNSDYYDYVNKSTDDDLINKNETSKLLKSMSTANTPTSSSSPNSHIYQKSLSSDSASRVSIKKPLVRIRPTTVKNESVRVKPSLIYPTQSDQSSNFDLSINSAQLNNVLSLDNHHRMILVNLLHTTLDATEV